MVESIKPVLSIVVLSLYIGSFILCMITFKIRSFIHLTLYIEVVICVVTTAINAQQNLTELTIISYKFVIFFLFWTDSGAQIVFIAFS